MTGPALASAPCGSGQGLGIDTFTELLVDAEGGHRLRMRAALFLAPLPYRHFRPMVLVDGRLLLDLGPQELPCGQEVAWQTPPLRPRHGVHWFLARWPEVPDALAGLSFEQALAAFGDRPPGDHPWGDAELRRPPGATRGPWQAAEPGAGYRWREATPEDHDEDRILLLDEAGRPMPDRLIRLRVGETRTLRVRHLLWGGAAEEELLLVCFAGGRQLPAFGGELALPLRARAGRVLEAEGQLRLERPGWHRLHCMLLPDGEGEAPFAGPKPLRNLFLWADP